MALFYSPTTSVDLKALRSKLLPNFSQEILGKNLIGSLVKNHLKEFLPAEYQMGSGHVANSSSLGPFKEIIIYDPSQHIIYQQDDLIIIPKKAVKATIQIINGEEDLIDSSISSHDAGQRGYLNILWWRGNKNKLSLNQKIHRILLKNSLKIPFNLVLMEDTYLIFSDNGEDELKTYKEAGGGKASPEAVLFSLLKDFLGESKLPVLEHVLEDFGWVKKNSISLKDIEITKPVEQPVSVQPVQTSVAEPEVSMENISSRLLAEIENNDVNLQDENGNTLLHRKARDGKLPDVRDLLAAGAAISIKNKDGNTPLHESVMNNQYDTTVSLINNGADVNAKNYLHNTPLHYAAEMNLNDIVHLLIDKKANIELKNKLGYTPLHVSARKGSYTSGLALIDNAASIEARTSDGLTTLHLAASFGQAELSQLLLDKGAELNALTEEKESALHLAASNGHVKLIKLLINNQADVSITNSKGETYLQCISYA